MEKIRWTVRQRDQIIDKVVCRERQGSEKYLSVPCIQARIDWFGGGSGFNSLTVYSKADLLYLS